MGLSVNEMYPSPCDAVHVQTEIIGNGYHQLLRITASTTKYCLYAATHQAGCEPNNDNGQHRRCYRHVCTMPSSTTLYPQTMWPSVCALHHDLFAITSPTRSVSSERCKRSDTSAATANKAKNANYILFSSTSLSLKRSVFLIKVSWI